MIKVALKVSFISEFKKISLCVILNCNQINIQKLLDASTQMCLFSRLSCDLRICCSVLGIQDLNEFYVWKRIAQILLEESFFLSVPFKVSYSANL